MAEKAKVPAVITGLNKAREYFYRHGFDKSGWNESQKFKFRSIDNLWPLISEALAAGNLVLLPYVESFERCQRDNARGGTNTYSVVHTKYRLVSTEDGSEIESAFTGEGADSGDKSMSKAHSMCVKYWAIAAFQIPIEGQDDADSSSPEQTAPQAPVNAPAEDPASRLPDLHQAMRDSTSIEQLRDLYEKGKTYIQNRSLDASHLQTLTAVASEIRKLKGW